MEISFHKYDASMFSSYILILVSIYLFMVIHITSFWLNIFCVPIATTNSVRKETKFTSQFYTTHKL